MNPLSKRFLLRVSAPVILLLGASLLSSCASTAEPRPRAAAVPERAPAEVRESVIEELSEVFAPIDQRSDLLDTRLR
ncbi:MAG: hypothetical protein ACLFRP_02295 [Puniceicoccaceae bacterium]